MFCLLEIIVLTLLISFLEKLQRKIHWFAVSPSNMSAPGQAGKHMGSS